jgi:hypothetical protein
MNDPMHSISADDWKRSIAQSRARPNELSEDIRRRLAEDRRNAMHAYQMSAEPILREMVKLRELYAVMKPIVIEAGSTLASAVIKPDQIRFELSPDAQRLYSEYEKTLTLLQETYLKKENSLWPASI